MSDELKVETPLRMAARKLSERLKGCHWPDGGFLSAIGEGRMDSDPERSAIKVMLSRELHHHEERLIPAEVDGIPVEMKVIGIILML